MVGTCVEDLAQKAREGNQLALQVFRDEARYLAIGASTIVNLINPEKLIIGGGVTQQWNLMSDTFFKTIEERTFANARRGTSVSVSELGDDAALLGGAVVANQTPSQTD